MIFKRTKIHKSYNFFINIILLLAAYLFIYFQLFYNKDLKAIFSFFDQQLQLENSPILFTIVVVLMPVNLILESLKWKYLIRKAESISFKKSLSCVLTGITISIFTPNRIGDFAGKVFLLKKANPWKTTFISILGSLSQSLTTFLCGSLGLTLLLILFSTIPYTEFGVLLFGLLSCFLVLDLVIILFYFKVSIVTDFISKLILASWRRIRVYLGVLSSFSLKELLIVLLLSLIRYLVFNFQLFILFRILSIHLSLFESFIISSSIFFILSFIPSIALAEIGIRGSVAIAVLGIFYDNLQIYPEHYRMGVVTAMSMLWLLNIILPAILGSFFVLKLRFFRRKPPK